MKKSSGKKSVISQKFNQFSNWVTKATGSPTAFLLALLIVLIWGICGPVFHFSEVWQLVINTGTTIITFLMMFVIQQSQNKDTMALHLKLNELIAANENTSNRLVGSEDLSNEELETIKKFYLKLSNLAKKEKDLFTTHSLDEAKEQHEEKHGKIFGNKSE